MNQTGAPEERNTVTRVIVFAFISFGFLLGNLIGLTAESIVKSLIPLLFAFVGGSAITFIGKLKEVEQFKASVAMGCFSLSCLLGVYTSLLIVENQLFTPISVIQSDKDGFTSMEERKLLRSTIFNTSSSIDQRVRSGQLDYEEAYKELQVVIETAK